MDNEIPEMSDPLGEYWRQPNRDEILIDDEHAAMDARAFARLKNYSLSVPTGTYPGKMWKRREVDENWSLCWYEVHPDPNLMAIKSRRILLV